MQCILCDIKLRNSQRATKISKNILIVLTLIKGQLISKGILKVFICTRKWTKIFLYICLQRGQGTLYHQLEDFNLTLLHYFFDLSSFYRLGQKYKNIFVCFLIQMKTLKSSFKFLWPPQNVWTLTRYLHFTVCAYTT